MIFLPKIDYGKTASTRNTSNGAAKKYRSKMTTNQRNIMSRVYESVPISDVLDDMYVISYKQRKLLKQSLNQDDVYSRETVLQAERLLRYLNDSGMNYELSPRDDGHGLLANVRIGKNKYQVTVMTNYRDDGEKHGTKKLHGAANVGNLSVNGHNYFGNSGLAIYEKRAYDDKGRRTPQRLLEMMSGKGLENESMSNLVLRRPISKNAAADLMYLYPSVSSQMMFGRYSNDSEDELVDEVIDEDLSPLEKMVRETNTSIRMRLEDMSSDDLAENENADEPQEIVLEDTDTFKGLNLDTLLAYNNRDDISEALLSELHAGKKINLYDPKIKGTPGLKNLLINETAGVDDVRQDERTLPNNYRLFLDKFKQRMTKLGVTPRDVHFDKDHVIHWNALRNGEVLKGSIGQVFLPDKNGVVKTGFKDGLNPDQIKDLKNKEVGYQLNLGGYHYERIQVNDETGSYRAWKRDIEVPDEKDPTKVKTSGIVTDKELMTLAQQQNYYVIPGYHGYYTSNQKWDVPLTCTVKVDGKNQVVYASTNSSGRMRHPFVDPNGNYVQFVDDGKDQMVKLRELNKSYREQGMIDQIGVERKMMPLHKRLRVRGYDQVMDEMVDDALASQIIRQESNLRDTSILNKLYHGDLYGQRISENELSRKGILDTLRNTVRFDNSVLDMTPVELGAKQVIGNDGCPQFDVDDRPVLEQITHRDNIPELMAIFDPSMTADGKALGVKRAFVHGVHVNPDGSVERSHTFSRSDVFDHLPHSEADPEDRSSMAANQYLKAREVVDKTNVALMTYKGYTFEDGCVVTDKYAKEHDLKIGDKLSDCHGNKTTISYIADPKQEEDNFFKENPDLDIVWNPHSVPTRFNTGVVMEMQDDPDHIKSLYHNGKKVGEMGHLSVIVTNITAENKTHTYEDEFDDHGNLVEKANRVGRSFSNQLGWSVASLDMGNVMREAYHRNGRDFGDLRSYLNVTGIDLDENGVPFTKLPDEIDPATGKPVNATIIKPGRDVELPAEGGYLELPVEVELESGFKTKFLPVLDESHRKGMDLYDGEFKVHEYSNDYIRIARRAARYNEVKEQLDADPSKTTERDEILKKEANALQSNVSHFGRSVVKDHLGGPTYRETDKFGNERVSQDTQAIKRSLVKRHIFGAEVPNSATSVVTANPKLDLDHIEVSPDIYKRLNFKEQNDRVLLWRDPCLHGGSARSFNVQVNEKLTGVAINPLVTDSFGMDFDGDTVGLWAPRTREAQHDLAEKGSIKSHLIGPHDEFDGNISQDLCAAAYKAGFVGSTIKKGTPLYGRTSINAKPLAKMKPKDQLVEMFTEMAHQPDGDKKIVDVWRKTVCSDYNIGASHINVSTRNEFVDSLMDMAATGAKGKVDAIADKSDLDYGDKLSYSDRINGKTNGVVKATGPLIPQFTTALGYYDRGLEIAQIKEDMKSQLHAHVVAEKKALPQRLDKYYKTPCRVSGLIKHVGGLRELSTDNQVQYRNIVFEYKKTGKKPSAEIIKTLKENIIVHDTPEAKHVLRKEAIAQKCDQSANPDIGLMYQALNDGRNVKPQTVEQLRALYGIQRKRVVYHTRDQSNQLHTKVKVAEPNGSWLKDYQDTRKARAGKVDYTGIAGKKSQQLAGIAFDTDPKTLEAALEMTEPLTQATVQLKHDPALVPVVHETLTEWGNVLDKGGLTREQFRETVDNLYGGTNKNPKLNLGLHVENRYKDQVFDMIVGDDGKTRQIDDVIQDKETSLMKTSLNGFDTIKTMSDDNFNKLRDFILDDDTIDEKHGLKSLTQEGMTSKTMAPSQKTMSEIASPSFYDEAVKQRDVIRKRRAMNVLRKPEIKDKVAEFKKHQQMQQQVPVKNEALQPAAGQQPQSQNDSEIDMDF